MGYQDRHTTDSAVISNMTRGVFPLPGDPVLLGQAVPGGLAAFTATLTFEAVPEPAVASLAAVALVLLRVLCFYTARRKSVV